MARTPKETHLSGQGTKERGPRSERVGQTPEGRAGEEVPSIYTDTGPGSPLGWGHMEQTQTACQRLWELNDDINYHPRPRSVADRQGRPKTAQQGPDTKTVVGTTAGRSRHRTCLSLPGCFLLKEGKRNNDTCQRISAGPSPGHPNCQSRVCFKANQCTKHQENAKRKAHGARPRMTQESG